MKEQIKLVQKVKNYFPKINVENINKAYNFGKKAHESQTRASGDPFFSHPFEVANILVQMKLDENSSIEFTRKNLEESWFDTFGSFTPIDSA